MEKLYRIVLVGVVLVVLVSVAMLLRVRERLVVCIDGYTLTNAKEVSIGRLSDVSFDKVPQGFLSVRHSADGFTWEVNKKCLRQDSLCYFKINNDNPNRHPLNDRQTIVVNADGRNHRLPVAELESLLGGHKSQYVLLRNALEKRRQLSGDLSGTDFREQRSIRSFFYRKKSAVLGTLGPWQLVILDTATSIEGDGQPITYTTSGTAGAVCKVQFYSMAEFSFKSNDKDLFHIGDINYMAKPELLTTEWGAGHALLRPDESGLSVGFPKPLTYTEDGDVLRDLTKGATPVVTLHQRDGSLPVGQKVFLPVFSTALPHEVCHIGVDDVMRVDTTDVRPAFNFLPRLQPLTVHTVNGTLHMHAGVIATGFLLSYLWLPLAIFLLIFLTYPRLVTLRGMQLDNNYCAYHLPKAFQMVAAIAFAYAVCKMMMVVKLSWTFPYFEKLTGVSVVDAGLILMLFFSLSLIFNHRFLTVRSEFDQKIGKRWSKWMAVGVSVAGVALCFWALRHTDRYFSADVLASYLPDECFSVNPFDWTDLSGINDLHRSVPYTLLLFNILAIVALVALNLGADRWLKGKRPTEPGNVKALVTAGIYALLVVVVSAIPGNFATAFITVLEVVGMGHALLLVDYSGHRLKAFATSLVISVVMLLAAIVLPSADTGYFTNYLGFACFIVFLYIIVEKYDADSSGFDKVKANKSEWVWMNVILGALMVFVVVVIPIAMRWYYDPNDVDYSRKTRRFMMFSQFNDYRNSGYRYAVSDTEFMTVMVHSMFNTNGADPLSPERHQLHPSVSTGQSPVVLNDVSMPVAFFGTYGWATYLVYFGLIVLLVTTVVGYSLPSQHRMDDGTAIDMMMVWRMLALMMWAGTSFYLYVSYTGRFPFTGRLNPGLGLDSVGEALESATLLAFMTATLLKQVELTTNKKSRL